MLEQNHSPQYFEVIPFLLAQNICFETDFSVAKLKDKKQNLDSNYLLSFLDSVILFLMHRD